MSELRRQLQAEIAALVELAPEDTPEGWAAWYRAAGDAHSRLASWRGRGHLVACDFYHRAKAKHELAGNAEQASLCERLAAAAFRCADRSAG